VKHNIGVVGLAQIGTSVVGLPHVEVFSRSAWAYGLMVAAGWMLCKSGQEERRKLVKRVAWCNLFHIVPCGSPYSRASPLNPLSCHLKPSKGSPHPWMRGGAFDVAAFFRAVCNLIRYEAS
jgi:hypothetical protein